MIYAAIASTLLGNKGAASMFETLVEEISAVEPDARFRLFSYYPERDRELDDDPRVEVLDARPVRLALALGGGSVVWRLAPPLRSIVDRFVPEVRALAESDVLVDQGGITFADGRPKFLVYNVATLLPALVLGVPVVKCAQALGPFRTRVNRWTAKAVLPRLDAIVARGSATRGFLDDLGLDNVETGTDLALLHRPVTDERPPDGAVRVGIAPSVVVEKQLAERGVDLVDLLEIVVDRQLAQGREVVLLPYSYRADTEATHNNDGPLVRRLAARLGERSGLEVIDEELRAAELGRRIAALDVLLSCRFHAMVAGLCGAVPTLVLGWSHKYAEVLERFGVEGLAVDVADADADDLSARLDALVADRAARSAALAERLPEVRELAAVNIDVFRRVAGRQSRSQASTS